jgi:hypothetical protein
LKALDVVFLDDVFLDLAFVLLLLGVEAEVAGLLKLFQSNCYFPKSVVVCWFL